MRDIEDLLKRTATEDFEVPQKIQHRIRYTLNNKERNNKNIFFKKLVTVVASFVLVLIGSVSVYAACGGTINGKPVIEWLGIKFSKEEYDNYKVEVKDKQFSYNETTINLVSTVCDEGFTILEFDVKLSKDDKKQLKLDEPVLPEGWENRTEEFEIDEVEEARIRSDFEGKYIDSIYISFNNQITYDVDGVFMDNINNYTVIIDGEEHWIRPRSAQTAIRISEFEYKIYQMYFLTDKELGDKKSFNMTLDFPVITSNYTQFGENDVYIPVVDGVMNIDVSKEKALNDTDIILLENEEIHFKNMTRKAEKVISTPLQTILKVSTVYENVSLQDLTNEKRESYIGEPEYVVKNENGKELSSWYYETKRVITYEDGSSEEWEQKDVGTSKKFKNAKLELTEYVVIEKDKNVSQIEVTVKDLKKGNEFGIFSINLDDK